jgi:hypothetical protein
MVDVAYTAYAFLRAFITSCNIVEGKKVSAYCNSLAFHVGMPGLVDIVLTPNAFYPDACLLIWLYPKRNPAFRHNFIDLLRRKENTEYNYSSSDKGEGKTRQET